MTDAVAVALITTSGTILMGWLNLRKTGKVQETVHVVKAELDGHMTKLLEEKGAAIAKGTLAEKERQEG